MGAPASHAARVTTSAAALVVLAVLCFAVLDAMSKDLARRQSIPLVVCVRYIMQTVALAAWLVPTMGVQALRTRRPGTHVVRALLLLGSSLFVVLGLRYLPLADATALTFTAPTLVALLAVVILHERITPLRIAFVIAGVIGMLMIVRPGTAMFQGAALWGLASALCYATYQVLTRRLAGEDSRVLLLYGFGVGAIGSCLLFPWFTVPDTVQWRDIVELVAIGVLGTVGHFLLITAFQRAPASAISPFTYAQLLFATLLGWLVFGHLPDGFTLTGMAIIGGSGLLVLWMEGRRTNR